MVVAADDTQTVVRAQFERLVAAGRTPEEARRSLSAAVQRLYAEPDDPVAWRDGLAAAAREKGAE